MHFYALIKGANYVEQISKANVFIFDKTGTLTKGDFSVIKVFPDDKRNEILKYAYICEKHSNHPIAKSICKECNFDNNEYYDIEEIAGKGVVARREGEEILCGNKWLPFRTCPCHQDKPRSEFYL